MGLGSLLIAPLSRWIITNYDWRTAMLTIGSLALVVIIPASLFVRRPPALAHAGGGAAAGADGHDFTMAQVLRTPQFAAIALTHFACCAAHSGPIFHMVSYAIDCGISSMTAATVFGVAGPRVVERTHHVRPDRRSRRCQADTGRRSRDPGACCESLRDHQGHHRLLCSGGCCLAWPSVA